MANVITGDWTKYAVTGNPSTDAEYNETCVPFSVVKHAAHVRPALDIVRDGKVKASRISDESHFRNSDLRVVWVSPFEWFMGSRYGGVQFSFDWAEILGKKNIYWAEVVQYSYPACRFLITSTSYPGNHEVLRRYDPTKGDGPWWYNQETKTHFQNMKVCVEFMIEEDLYLYESQAVTFVDHHRKYCCLHPRSPESCKEKDLPASTAGSLFLGQLVGAHVDGSNLRLVEERDGTQALSETLVQAWNDIHNRLWRTEDGYLGRVAPGDPAAEGVARGVLSALGQRKTDERKALARLFGSREQVIASCKSLLETSLGLPVELPIGDE